MRLDELELEVLELLVDVVPLLDLRHRLLQLLVRRAAKVLVAHPVAAGGLELRIEVEARPRRELHGLQSGVSVLYGHVHRNRKRIVRNDAVIDDLPDRNDSLRKSIVLGMAVFDLPRVAEVGIKRIIEISGEIIVSTFAGKAAEVALRDRGACTPELRPVRRIARMAAVAATQWLADRHHVEISYALEPKRRHARYVAGGELLVGTLRTHVVRPPPAPRDCSIASRQHEAVLVLERPLAVPVSGNRVPLEEVAVRHDEIPSRLRMAYRFLQLGVAAELRL